MGMQGRMSRTEEKGEGNGVSVGQKIRLVAYHSMSPVCGNESFYLLQRFYYPSSNPFLYNKSYPRGYRVCTILGSHQMRIGNKGSSKTSGETGST